MAVTVVNRRPARLLKDADGTRRRVGEVAGGTAAECAVVACCCPCVVVELVLLAVYKVPAELCKKAWRRNKRRRKSLPASVSHDSVELARMRTDVAEKDSLNISDVDEMWPHFHITGFWRSPDRDD